MQEVRDQVDRLRSNPQLYTIGHNLRAAPLPSFSYIIYYRDRGADILIVAVLHSRRSRRALRGRV